MNRAAASLQAGAQALLDDFPVDLAWSADGRHVLVAGGEGKLHRVTAADGGVELLGEQQPGLLSVACQPGGKLVATAGQDGAVRLWDGASSVQVHRGMG